MWHEQRRTEKMIKGMMVDRQKRAERRRAYYDKFRADPNQFLQVHGQSMKVHYDPVLALAADNPVNMMPWNGDRQILIDRFDVRANLDFIPEYKPPKEEIKLDYKEVKEQRNVNYERYRILIQNEFLSIHEEKFLKMIDLEEKYGGTTYQNEKAKADKKKSANNKAAIGFVYADSTVPEPESEPEPSDSDTDSEPDFDLNVDVMALGTQEQESINTIGIGFELGKKDFVKMLARDVEEAEELRMEREKDNEKSKLSGKKSRRERKLLKEKMLEGRRVSSPSFAAKDERSRSRSYSESESESEEGGGEEDKVEFITSFGGDSDPENTKKGLTFRKTKEYKDPIGPTLPEPTKKKKKKKEKKSSHRSRKRSRSRSRRRGGRSRSRDRRSRRRRRDRSRSAGSKSSGRSSLNSREGSPVQDVQEPEPEQAAVVEEQPPPEVAPPISRYAPASNHHPSMLAYPPPPKPDYMTSLDMMEKDVPPPMIKPQPITPGFVPPLPKLPHPDDLVQQKTEKEEKKDTSDSSDAEEENKNGYRSKYRNKAASSDEEIKPSESLYQSSISSFFTGVSKNVATLDGAGNGGSQLEPPPVKRYYGRRRENDSDSELSGLDSDSESKKRISHKIKQRVEKKTKEKTASKETLAEREKIRKKMQSQLKKTYKEDKKAEQERLKKLEEEQFYREEEMRELSAKMKEKEREKRRLERSRSRSRSRDRRRSRSRNRRQSRSQDRRRSSERKDGRRSRSRNDSRRHETGGLVDY